MESTIKEIEALANDIEVSPEQSVEAVPQVDAPSKPEDSQIESKLAETMTSSTVNATNK